MILIYTMLIADNTKKKKKGTFIHVHNSMLVAACNACKSITTHPVHPFGLSMCNHSPGVISLAIATSALRIHIRHPLGKPLITSIFLQNRLAHRLSSQKVYLYLHYFLSCCETHYIPTFIAEMNPFRRQAGRYFEVSKADTTTSLHRRTAGK